MPRGNRIVYPGYPHHIVQYGHNRQGVFRDDQDRRYYIGLLGRYTEQHRCGVMAYCLMSNHVHLMLRPASCEGLAECLHGIGMRYAMYFNRAEGRCGALWNSRYFSSAIGEEDYMWRAAQYICLNPVRAGIVSSPADYYWSSAGALMYGHRDGVPLEDWLDDEYRFEFRAVVLDGIEERRITVAVRSNRPYGSVNGIAELENHGRIMMSRE